jgi:hypothetical protein
MPLIESKKVFAENLLALVEGVRTRAQKKRGSVCFSSVPVDGT